MAEMPTSYAERCFIADAINRLPHGDIATAFETEDRIHLEFTRHPREEWDAREDKVELVSQMDLAGFAAAKMYGVLFPRVPETDAQVTRCSQRRRRFPDPARRS
jgi:hypothetical protein